MSPKSELAEALARHQLHPKRGLGQCFLIDPRAIDRIASLATAGDPPAVVEIGAGPGVLTTALAARARRVIAVERDRTIIPLLTERTAASGNVRIVEADATRTDFAALAKEDERPPSIAGNLPYNVTTPLLLAFLAQRAGLGPATVMVQREVAARLTARPDTKDYGSLTLLFRLHADVERSLELSPAAFWPAPKVHSTVLHIRWLPRPRIEVPDTALLERVVRAAFGQRRKTLRNALSAAFERDAIDRAAAAASIDLDRRGETLTLDEFARLAGAL